MKSKAKSISNVSESRKAGLAQALKAPPQGGKTIGLKHSEAEGPKSAASAPKMKI